MAGPERAQELVGTVLAERYRVTSVLAESTAGATLSAEHVHMRHRVAVKVLYPEAAQRSELLVQFEREALSGAHVSHDNVAAATDYGALPSGLRFLVMEYLEGPTLREVLARGPLPIARALAIAAKIAHALASMHARGIIHRALCPDSVRLVQRGGESDVVKVVDFGSAQLPTSLIADEADARRQTRIATPVRVSGKALSYCSPELTSGADVDGRSDLYALGVLLFELLLGAPPPAGVHPVPSVRTVRDDAPEALDGLLGRLLSPRPEERASSAEEVADALEDLAQQARKLAPHARPAFASAPTAYGGHTPSPASVAIVRQAPAHSAEVSGGWVPLAKRAAEVEPRLPVPQRLWLASGGTASIFVLIVAIVALRSEPFPGGAAVEASSSSSEPTLPDGTSGHGERRDDDGGEAPTGDDPDKAGGSSGSAPKNPLISLGDVLGGDTLKGDPALGTTESLKVFDDFKLQRRKRALKSATATLDRLLTMNPRAPEDAEVRKEIYELAQDIIIGYAEETELVYGWLSTRLAHHGPDILYKLVTEKGGSNSAKRAERILKDPKVQKRFSEELDIAYRLRMELDCSAQPKLFERAVQKGDRRAYGALIRVREFCKRGGQCCREHFEAVKTAIKRMEVERGFR